MRSQSLKSLLLILLPVLSPVLAAPQPVTDNVPELVARGNGRNSRNDTSQEGNTRSSSSSFRGSHGITTLSHGRGRNRGGASSGNVIVVGATTGTTVITASTIVSPIITNVQTLSFAVNAYNGTNFLPISQACSGLLHTVGATTLAVLSAPTFSLSDAQTIVDAVTLMQPHVVTLSSVLVSRVPVFSAANACGNARVELAQIATGMLNLALAVNSRLPVGTAVLGQQIITGFNAGFGSFASILSSGNCLNGAAASTKVDPKDGLVIIGSTPGGTPSTAASTAAATSSAASVVDPGAVNGVLVNATVISSAVISTDIASLVASSIPTDVAASSVANGVVAPSVATSVVATPANAPFVGLPTAIPTGNGPIGGILSSVVAPSQNLGPLVGNGVVINATASSSGLRPLASGAVAIEQPLIAAADGLRPSIKMIVGALAPMVVGVLML